MEHAPVGKRIKGRFAKGHSGNPTGRPPVPKPIQELFSSQVELAAKAITEALNGSDPRLKLIAAQEVLNRVYGKPVTPAHVKVEEVNAAQSIVDALRAVNAAAQTAIEGDVIEVEAEEIRLLCDDHNLVAE